MVLNNIFSARIIRAITITVIVTAIGFVLLLFLTRNSLIDTNSVQVRITLNSILEKIAQYERRCKKRIENLYDLEKTLKNLQTCPKLESFGFVEGHSESKDPWGNEIIFKRENSSKYFLISLGADGKNGGSENNSDIILEVNGNVKAILPSDRN